MPLEYVRGHRCGAIWQVLAELFNTFIARGYPPVLNQMLLMPLHKRGDPADCSNYRGISLMHPWGRLFSKVVVCRLEVDPAATRARAQAGFRKFHRVEDNCVILQTALELAAVRGDRLYCVFVDL